MAAVGLEQAVIDRWDGGVGWIAHPEELMQRASHALVGERGIWLVDPLDMDGLDGILAEYGEVAGVVVTLDRHTRDAATLASRHGVAVHLPEGIAHVAGELDARTATIDPFLADTGYRAIQVVDLPTWREYALYHPDAATIIFADAIGAAPHFRVRGERVGVHPALRLLPPRSALSHVTAERLLVGHGEGIMEGGTMALHDALQGSRRRAPLLYAKTLSQLPTMIGGTVRQ